MGPVADGTVCKDGSIAGASDGDCSVGGTLSCSPDGSMFFLCDEGMLEISCLSSSREVESLGG